MILAHWLHIASALPTDASALESAISALQGDISALEKDISGLANSSLPWEHSSLWCTLIVAVGVAMEWWVIRHEWHDDMAAWRRGILRPPDRPSFLKLLMEYGSVLLIVAGVIGELGAGLEMAFINKSLRAKNQVLQSKSAELLDKGDQLVELLHRETEDERVARVEAEESIAWRSLNKEKQWLIASHLNRFVSQPASLWYNVGDREAELFAFDIGEALQNGKWVVYAPASKSDWAIPGRPFGTAQRSETGVTLSIPESGIGNTAGKALFRELTALGFDASILGPSRRGQNAGTQVVVVGVEVKPEGPQGEYKLQAGREAKAKNAAKSK